jgi:hypothetical protein
MTVTGDHLFRWSAEITTKSGMEAWDLEFRKVGVAEEKGMTVGLVGLDEISKGNCSVVCIRITGHFSESNVPVTE